MQIVAVPNEAFTLPSELLWIYIIALATAIMYIVATYGITMRIRMQVFNKQFMAQFDKEHEEAFGPGTKAPDAGFPDSGNGRFAKKLTYADWFKMNNG